MDYRVVVVCDGNSVVVATMNLERKVKELIEQGWKLQGGVSVSKEGYSSSSRLVMAQAMIKG